MKTVSNHMPNERPNIGESFFNIQKQCVRTHTEPQLLAPGTRHPSQYALYSVHTQYYARNTFEQENTHV